MEEIIEKVKEIIREKMLNESSGHDYWHVLRVYKNTILLMEEEKEEINKDVIKLAALLHDIGDYKLTGSEETLTELPKKILKKLQVEEKTLDKVIKIIGEISFHKQTEALCCLESQIVQDADRLDAIGAIGIARAFAYGGVKNREIWNPEQPAKLSMSEEEYKKNKGNSVNHFYEKLLLLKEKMNTNAGKRIAEERHIFMEQFLHQFFAEWEGLK